MAYNTCDPQFKKPAKILRIAKISPILKKPKRLPRRLSNFGKAKNFVFFLAIIIFNTCLDKITTRNGSSSLVRAVAGQNNF